VVNIGVFSKDNNKLSISSYPNNLEKYVDTKFPLTVWAKDTGSFSIFYTSIAALDSNMEIWLKDNYLNKIHKIDAQFYPFKITANPETMGDKRFLRGRHTFEQTDTSWECVSEMVKPKRAVGIPSKMREVRAQTKETCDWVKGLWAISGDDGTHPWFGKVVERTRSGYGIEELADPERREAFVLSLLPSFWKRNPVSNEYQHAYAGIDAKKLVTSINEYFYESHNCYTTIDYDAPIPRE
jgi:hypothetical protein